MKTMVTVKEYAAHCGIGLNNVRRMAHIVGFPALRVGSKIMIHVDGADEWLKSRAENEKLDRAVK